MILRVQLTLLCVVAAVASHRHGEWRCDHDLAAPDEITYRVGLRRPGTQWEKYHHVGKRAADQPFRMFVYYDSSVNTELSPSLTTSVRNTIEKLKVFFQQVLSVRPTQGPILLERNCVNGTYYYPVSGSDDRRCVYTCETTSTCGNVTIPADHLKACIECNGNSSTCETVGSDGGGVGNFDFMLYVSAKTMGSCPTPKYPSPTIAFASACQMESEYDRPIAGRVNFCPISIADDEDDKIMEVAKHEILHALGFSHTLYPWWRDENGVPRTPRDPHGYPIKDENGDYVTSTNTMKTITYTNWETRFGPVSHNVTMLVTPRIQQEARNHFGCQTLKGMELENQGGNGTASSHWEKRLVENEGMTGIYTGDAVFSRLTFALLEDSGWYKVNYSMAEQLVWGNKQGCKFVAGSCGGFIKSQQQKDQPLSPFCNILNDKKPIQHIGCTISRNFLSYCNLQNETEPVPAEYQYLQSGANFDSSTTNLSHIGGNLEAADFCPYQLGFTDAECSDPTTDLSADLVIINGMYFGNGARCVEQGDKPWTASVGDSNFTSSIFGAGCYQYSCSASIVTITIFNSSYNCTEKGQIIDVEVTESGVTLRGTLICPSCVDICYDDFENCPEAAELFGEVIEPSAGPSVTTPSGSPGDDNVGPSGNVSVGLIVAVTAGALLLALAVVGVPLIVIMVIKRKKKSRQRTLAVTTTDDSSSVVLVRTRQTEPPRHFHGKKQQLEREEQENLLQSSEVDEIDGDTQEPTNLQDDPACLSGINTQPFTMSADAAYSATDEDGHKNVLQHNPASFSLKKDSQQPTLVQDDPTYFTTMYSQPKGAVSSNPSYSTGHGHNQQPP